VSSLSELAATGDTITVAGKTYRLAPPSLDDIAEIHAQIKKERGDPIETVRKLTEGMSAEERRPYVEQAYKDAIRSRHVTPEEEMAWGQTTAGVLYAFWVRLRKHHPEMTVEKVAGLIEQLGSEEIAEAMEVTSGLPEGNPTSTEKTTSPSD
jgi:hypothetical protein